MVIISPILERDANHGDILWNTAVVISHCGQILGKQRKNHIPNNGESEYYAHGTNGHQVFDTIFGRIGVSICFDRHHSLSWLIYALNGAEIVFNPAATVCIFFLFASFLQVGAGDCDSNFDHFQAVNEHWWHIETRNASFAHSYYTVAINRVGIEQFQTNASPDKTTIKNFGPCFGSSYISAPDGSRTKVSMNVPFSLTINKINKFQQMCKQKYFQSLSRNRDGILLADLDLNMCKEMQQQFGFHESQRLSYYKNNWLNAANLSFVPQIIQ